MTQDTHFRGDAKGCGFDIGKLESNEDDNGSVLAVYALHKVPKTKPRLELEASEAPKAKY